MRFGGSGWKPDNRRSRRQGRAPRRSTEKGADRAFILILVLFAVAVRGLVLLIGFLGS
ncbi:MAG: hypothetical protein M3522_02005 [Actinomycetota bacterium]|nr:hypothetical protein [Actinomycetota bacterium]